MAKNSEFNTMTKNIDFLANGTLRAWEPIGKTESGKLIWLVLVDNGGFHPWVVSRYLDGSTSWVSGRYFADHIQASNEFDTRLDQEREMNILRRS